MNLQKFQDELHAAQVLQAAPTLRPPSVLGHLRTAMEAMSECPDQPLPDDAKIQAARVGFEAAWNRCTNDMGSDDGDDNTLHRRTGKAVQEGNILLSRLERKMSGHSKRENRWRASLMVMLATPLLVFLPPLLVEPPQVWRIEYHRGLDFSGPPIARTTDKIRFNWRKRNPTESILRSNFSAKFDTCLQLDSPAQMSFKLISEDGSKLSIDGETIVDNSGATLIEARGKTVNLGVGVHHLRIDYSNAGQHGSLILLASFDPDEPPSMLAPEFLDFPRAPISSENPCELPDTL